MPASSVPSLTICSGYLFCLNRPGHRVDREAFRRRPELQRISQNLTEARLDLIHRFLRLWKKTGWTIPEFDLLLGALRTAGLVNTLEGNDAPVPQDPCCRRRSPGTGGTGPGCRRPGCLVSRIPDTPLAATVPASTTDCSTGKRCSVSRRSPLTERKPTNRLPSPADKTLDKLSTLVVAGLGINESELGTLFALLQINTAADITIDHALISRSIGKRGRKGTCLVN